MQTSQRHGMSEFGDELKRRRKIARLSLDALAERAQLSKTYVANIERDTPHSVTGKKYTPSVDTVDRLAIALDWPLSEARPLAGYAHQFNVFISHHGEYDQLPPELENIYAMHGKVLNALPEGPARERYIEKLRADAEASLAMIEARLGENQH